MFSKKSLALYGLVAVLGLTSTQLKASSVAPIRIDGTPAPHCQELGYDYEIKRDDPTPGETSVLDTGSGLISIETNASDDAFNWSSEIGIDAVIVKGGPTVNIYHYDDETTSDANLNAPFNDNSGTNYGLSFVAFCFDYEVQAAMTTDNLFFLK